MNSTVQSEEDNTRSRIVLDANNPDASTREMAILIEIALRMMLDKVPDDKISQYTRISLASLDYIRFQYLSLVIESGIDMVKQEILRGNVEIPRKAATTKEERKLEKERIRKKHQDILSDPSTFDDSSIEGDLRCKVALQMMKHGFPNEKVRRYTKLSLMEIEYIRIELLPKTIKDIECKNRAMNESLRR